MSITTVTDRLASIQSTSITGMKKAYGLSDMPNKLAKSNLPAATNLPGEAEYEARGQDRQAEIRIYLMNFYFCSLESPADIGRQAKIAEPFFLRIKQTFADRPTLESLRYIEEALIIGDGGITALTYGGVDYLGVQFQIRVTELMAITHDDEA